MPDQLERICHDLGSYIRQITLGSLESAAIDALMDKEKRQIPIMPNAHSLSALVTAQSLLELANVQLLEAKGRCSQRVGVAVDASRHVLSVSLNPPLQTGDGSHGPCCTCRCRGCERASAPVRDWNKTLYPAKPCIAEVHHTLRFEAAAADSESSGAEVVDVLIEEEECDARTSKQRGAPNRDRRSGE